MFADFSADAFLEAVMRAVERYREGKSWQGLMKRAMAGDWSWESSASEYETLYRKMLAPVTGR